MLSTYLSSSYFVSCTFLDAGDETKATADKIPIPQEHPSEGMGRW